MTTSSTTVRVSLQTRERLTAQARQRGISVSALIAELAARADRESMFRAEREATRAEASSDGAVQEDMDWARAAGDGID